VLIDRNNYHQFQPLFYQVAMAGLEPSSIVFPLRKMFQKFKNVFIRVTEVTAVEPEQMRLQTPMGIVNYDHLVLAMGADTNFFGNERIAEKAIPMKSVGEALLLRNSIFGDLESAMFEEDYDKRQGYIDIVIVGGGATGVEVAGALAEMRKYVIHKDYPELNCDEIDIYLLQGGDCLLKGMSPNASNGAKKYLEDLGVNVLLNTRVTDFDGEYVHTKDGKKIQAKKVIWAAGIVANTLKGMPEETMVWGKRLKVNQLHEVEGMEHIYAIGDLCYMEEEAFPKGHPQVAQVAIQNAKNLANNFKAKLKNKAPKSFKYNDLGSMATIGRNRAVVDLPKFKFKGAFAWFVWLFVHLASLIGARNKMIVFFNWVWNYLFYDQSLRLIIKAKKGNDES